MQSPTHPNSQTTVARLNECGLPENFAQFPATHLGQLHSKVFEYAAISVPQHVDEIFDPDANERPYGFVASTKVSTDANLTTWFGLAGNNRDIARQFRGHGNLNHVHIYDRGTPQFVKDEDEGALPFDEQRAAYKDELELYTSVNIAYNTLRRNLIDYSPAADKAAFLSAVPTMSIRDILEHLRLAYEAAAHSDTTLLNDCLAPCDWNVPASTVLAAFDRELALVDVNQRRPYDTNNHRTEAFLNKWPTEIQDPVRASLNVHSVYVNKVARELNEVGFRTAFLTFLEANRITYVETHGAANRAGATPNNGRANVAKKQDCWGHGIGCGHSTKDCHWINKYAAFKALQSKSMTAKATITHNGVSHQLEVGFLKYGKDPVNGDRERRVREPRKQGKAAAATAGEDTDEA